MTVLFVAKEHQSSWWDLYSLIKVMMMMATWSDVVRVTSCLLNFSFICFLCMLLLLFNSCHFLQFSYTFYRMWIVCLATNCIMLSISFDFLHSFSYSFVFRGRRFRRGEKNWINMYKEGENYLLSSSEDRWGRKVY